VTYTVVFDVSERLPQLALGMVAVVLVIVLAVTAVVRRDGLLPRWPLVLGIGAGVLAAQFLLGQLWAFALAVAVVSGVIIALELAGRPEDHDWQHVQPGVSRRMPYGQGALLAGIVALAVAAFLGLPMAGAIDLERRLLAGDATVVDGPVMIEAGGKQECLVVDAQRFCYSNAEVQPGYNRVQTILGGPFATGDLVRLSIIDGQIVRIEVATPT
jgi:hypothetical protein